MECLGSLSSLNPVLINVEVATRDLLARAYHDSGVREAGLLGGVILEVPDEDYCLEATPFMEGSDENLWCELITRLFARRIGGQTKLYRVDTGGFDACEGFREWCRLTDSAGLATWPAILLKLALAIHIAGNAEDDTLDTKTVVAAAEVLKGVGTKQIALLQSLDGEPPEDAAIRRMVGKLRLHGGTATMRELFRRYSGQNYDLLAPVLERAVAIGEILRDGNILSLPVNVSASMVS